MIASSLRRLRDAVFQPSADAMTSVAIGGRTYRLPAAFGNPLLAEARRSDAYEPWFKALIGKLASFRKGAIVDVGANVGQTMLAVLAADPDRQYIGFEPQVRCCQSIQGFIDENGLGHYSILPVGLSDQGGIFTLSSRKLHDKSASLVADYRPEGFHPFKSHVAVMKGDDAIAAIDPDGIAVVKIDVEGAELAVLRGLSGTLARYRPAIIFEVLPDTLLITGEKLDQATRDFRHRLHGDIFAEFAKHGYALFLIEPDGSLREVRELVAHEDQMSNYLAVSSEDRAALLAAR